jgi:hypothetical protein
MHENIVSGYICIFVTLHRKPRILNTRFVFYNIKIQKNPQNKYITRFFLGAGSSSAHVAGLNPGSLARSLAQTSDPAGHCCKLHA